MHGRINDVFGFQECRLGNELQLPPQLKRRQEKKKTEKEIEELKRIMERAILSRIGSAMRKITPKKKNASGSVRIVRSCFLDVTTILSLLSLLFSVYQCYQEQDVVA